jgi:hypothetical protein
LFGPGVGIMGIALGDSSSSQPLLSPLLQLGSATSPLSDGYALSLNAPGGPQLVVGGPLSTTASTVSVPLIKDAKRRTPMAYPLT